MLRLWSFKSGRVFVLDADPLSAAPPTPLAIWPVEQYRFFNELTDAPRYSLNPIDMHMDRTEVPDFVRP